MNSLLFYNYFRNRVSPNFKESPIKESPILKNYLLNFGKTAISEDMRLFMFEMWQEAILNEWDH